MASKNSFGALSTLKAGEQQYQIFRLEALEKAGVANVRRIPYCVKVLLENGIQPDILVLRTERNLTSDIKRKVALFCNVEESTQNKTYELACTPKFFILLEEIQ